MELFIMHLRGADHGLTIYPSYSEYIIADIWSEYKVKAFSNMKESEPAASHLRIKLSTLEK